MTTNYMNAKLMTLVTVALFSTLTLTACVSNRPSYQNNRTIIKNAQGVPNYHMVKQGETVSKIASRYGINYRTVGKLNGLNSKYTIYPGQWLKLWNDNSVSSKVKTSTGRKNTQNNDSRRNTQNNKGYQYPTRNKVIRQFSVDGSDGMWFTGRLGDAVYASQGGVVLYAGSGLPEFGNLVMIRHNDNLVTAYAHNSRMLVKEGDTIKRGQKIATMGKTGNTNQVGLQLQVRKDGTAIDPRVVLGTR